MIEATLASDLAIDYAYHDALGRCRSMLLTKPAHTKVRVSSIDNAIPGCHSAAIEFEDGKCVRVSLSKLTNAKYIKDDRKKNRTNYKEVNSSRVFELKMVSQINYQE